MAKKKTSKKKKTSYKKKKKPVTRYKSLYTDRPVTIQQFLVEVLYANNRIKDITKYIGGNMFRRKEYIKHQSIISRLLKKISPEDLYLIITKNKIKDPTHIQSFVEKLQHLEDLSELPKDYSEKKDQTFDPGPDLRNNIEKAMKKLTFFEQISELGEKSGKD